MKYSEVLVPSNMKIFSVSVLNHEWEYEACCDCYMEEILPAVRSPEKKSLSADSYVRSTSDVDICHSASRVKKYSHIFMCLVPYFWVKLIHPKHRDNELAGEMVCLIWLEWMALLYLCRDSQLAWNGVSRRPAGRRTKAQRGRPSAAGPPRLRSPRRTGPTLRQTTRGCLGMY